MDSRKIIENAVSKLANSMRIYVEAQMRFGELFKIDAEEAIDNVDRGFEMKLEAFHTLYDVSKVRCRVYLKTGFHRHYSARFHGHQSW